MANGPNIFQMLLVEDLTAGCRLSRCMALFSSLLYELTRCQHMTLRLLPLARIAYAAVVAASLPPTATSHIALYTTNEE